MDLPGIGTFTLDAAAIIPQESDRMGHVPASGITFKNANIPAPDDTLINFIKDHTGKMKSLAASDLDFFLTTGRQLLNIGKPFYLEGIGTLIKNKEGKLDFAPGEYLVTRIEEPAGERKQTTFDEPRQEASGGGARNSRQTLLLVALVIGLIIVGWGGYYLYKRNNFVEPSPGDKATVIPEAQTAAKPDSTTAQQQTATDTTAAAKTTPPATEAAPPKKDSARTRTVAAQQPAVTQPTLKDPVPGEGESLYHFVILQTENKGHALRRYNQLLGYQLNIRLAQKDSAFFKLYFPIAAAPKDTAHIRDSLADVYASHVSIEQ
jgi:hypothetical protein